MKNRITTLNLHRRLFLAPLLFMALLSSCSAGRQYQAPEMAPAPAFKAAETGRFRAEAPITAWWSELSDAKLARLVERALAHNHDVRIALANLRQARAIARETGFDRLPTVTAGGAALRRQVTAEGAGGRPAERAFDTFEGGFDATWEMDLYGRISQRMAAARADWQVSEAELRGVYVTVAAEVARTYIELRGAQYRLSVARENARNQAETHGLTLALAEEGRSNALDIQRALAQLELTRSTVPAQEARVNAAINRLGVLTGQMPEALGDELFVASPLPTIPETIRVGDPVDLIRRRPDVRRAERALAASVARYNIRAADLYPQVTLAGSLGFSAAALSDLGTGGAATFLFGPRIHWAAFDLGRVRARMDAADARTEALLAAFEKSVLQALEETDTAMVNFSRQEETRARLLRAAEASARAARHARERFDAGIDNFLDVLDAERTLLEAQDRLARAETELAGSLIAIYKALSGGWGTAPRSRQDNDVLSGATFDPVGHPKA